MLLTVLGHIIVFTFQATEELKLESDRRFRLEEALRCARICVRCGHPRVFITGIMNHV